MPLTVEALRTLALASGHAGTEAWDRTLAEQGSPSLTQLGSDAAAHLDSDDRNVRVAALRVIAFSEGSDAAEGILRGLDDPVKRVREVAAKCSARFVDDPRVLARLRRAFEENERGSARPAMQILSGLFRAPNGLRALEPVTEALAAMARTPAFRQQALFALLRARTLTAEVSALLQDFVRDGTKDEAVMATRRLCGFRVVHDAELDDEARRTAELAWGRVFYWVPKTD